MKKYMKFLYSAAILLVLLSIGSPVMAGKDSLYQTGFKSWRAGGFADWTLEGVTIASDGSLQLIPNTVLNGSDPYPAGEYNGGDFYNGGSFLVGKATSPEIVTPFGFTEAIASWNAATPAGTWIEILISARINDAWTKEYNLGVWAADYSTINRHSVNQQGDTNGTVSVDTLVLTSKKASADAFKLSVRLFSTDGAAVPSVRFLSVAYNSAAGKKPAASTGNSDNWNTLLNVPECSQMVYPDGGNVWCSPTSVSMVLGYWGIDPGECEPRVRAAVDGVYDWVYDGHGNWPFNTAYAAARGMEAYVTRFTSLEQVEPWVKAGVPVVMSFAWGKGDLTGAAVPSSNGHLVVLVGFDAQGNPIINDPAAAADVDVQRTYLRSEFEPLWLSNSGGTVYLIYPPGHPVP